MNISFDEVTKNTLKQKLEEKGKSAVRLLIRGFG